MKQVCFALTSNASDVIGDSIIMTMQAEQFVESILFFKRQPKSSFNTDPFRNLTSSAWHLRKYVRHELKNGNKILNTTDRHTLHNVYE